MHLSLAYSLLACTAVRAFSDSAPFVLFSTSELPSSSSNDQLQSSTRVLSAATDILSSCPTERYLLVSQPNANAGDIRDGSTCNMPNLCRAIASDAVHGRFSVAEVVGRVSVQPISEAIRAACESKRKPMSDVSVTLAALPSLKDQKSRTEVLAQNDYELGQLLADLGDDYTVVLFSDPVEPITYEATFQDPVHMDLKRHSDVVEIGKRKGNSTTNQPLFERYQFFTPGIFMSLIAVIVMLSILGVGIKALSSLEVSYGAFEKEMGPGAQKKQL